MISLADTSVNDALEKLGAYGLRATIIVPTNTGLEKSIMDATAPIREYLRNSEIHDFYKQGKGGLNKVEIETYIHLLGDVVQTKTSLYRPETKNGDPRIWVSNLGRYASSGNVIAIIAFNKCLHVINMSRDFDRIVVDPTDILRHLLGSQQQSAVFQILLSSLRSIAARGWIKSMRDGDTGVGFTLESLLGIKANSSRSPDFQGIEIKSSRVNARRIEAGRVSLFSKTPEWKLTKSLGGMTARELINTVGSEPETGANKQYYATIYPKSNPQNVRSAVRDRVLEGEKRRVFETLLGENLIHCWPIHSLENALRKKHKETVFVDVESYWKDGVEYFLFKSVAYRSLPMFENLELLLTGGDITLDYTLKILSNTRVRDHGYLFRMQNNRLNKLFAKESRYELVDPVEISSALH